MSESCIFCLIAKGTIPAERVYEDEQVIAIRDIDPQAPSHLLVLPRQHVAGLPDLAASNPLWNALVAAVQAVAASEGLSADGFRLVVNTGARAGQSVPHLHLHVLGGRDLHWPPG